MNLDALVPPQGLEVNKDPVSTQRAVSPAPTVTDPIVAALSIPFPVQRRDLIRDSRNEGMEKAVAMPAAADRTKSRPEVGFRGGRSEA